MSSVSDPVADFLTRVRNGSRSGVTCLSAPHSRLIGEVARILVEEGFLDGTSTETVGGFKRLSVRLKYVNGRSVISNLQRVSRPGLRRYVPAGGIPRVLSGIGISILSTSCGVLSSREARRRNVGGELLAFVW